MKVSSSLYSPIDSTQKDIRVVILAAAPNFSDDVHCRLRHVSLLGPEPPPPYEALSYVWGESSVTGEIFLHGESVRARTNLVSALRHLRFKSAERVLWVDALAINQDDISEREEQVAIMGLIYACAQRDLLWMGAEFARYQYATYVLAHRFDEDEEVAAAEFARLIRGKRSVWDHLVKFFEAAVWERMWIVQEIALASEVRVLCGLRELRWTSLKFVANILTSPKYVERSSPSSIEGMVQVMSTAGFRDFGPYLRPEKDLLFLWYKLGWATCHDPRDRIYAVLSLIENDLNIKPNYRIEADELFCDVTRKYILQRKSLRILGHYCRAWPVGAVRSTLRGHGIGNGSTYSNVPSWCLDFGSSAQPYSPRFFLRAAYNQDSSTIVPWTDRSSEQIMISEDPRQLVVFGLLLDKATIVTESTSSCSHSEVIDKYYTYRLDVLDANESPNGVYFNGDATNYCYWVTVCAGLFRTSKDSWEVSPWKSPTIAMSREGMQENPLPRTSKTEVSLDTPSNLKPDIGSDSDAKYRFEATLVETTKDHSFCMTEKRYMALVPDTTRPGDLLCVLHGGCTPFVLRPTSRPSQIDTPHLSQGVTRGLDQASGDMEEFFTLIGPAYVHGFMGSLPLRWLEEGRLDERRFILV